MPRDRFDDPDTPGLFVQVNCRRAADPEGGGTPGHLQISTHDERADARVRELLDEAGQLINMLTSAVRSGEQDSQTMIDARSTWRTKVDTFRAELTGTYVTLVPDTVRPLIKQLHRGWNLAYPGGAERVPGVLDGIELPHVSDAVRQASEPQPGVVGATGYKLPPAPRQG
jgi:hypothetical protein